MSLPFGHVDTTFERFLQELPADFSNSKCGLHIVLL